MRKTTTLSSDVLFGGVDPVEATIYLNAKYTLLPEIFEIFGREHAMHFIEVFGGKTFKVPPQAEIENAFAQLAMWSALRVTNDTPTVKRLCARYEVTQAEVRAAFRRVQDMFNAQAKRFAEVVEEGSGTSGTEAGTFSAPKRNAPAELGDLFGAD